MGLPSKKLKTMKRVRCPKCDNYVAFDETKYENGQSLVFECPQCGKQFTIRIGVSKLRALQKEEKVEENLKDSVPAFNVGDTVKVSVKVVEGTRERIQAFEGVVIAKKNGGIRETFTVRRLSYGVGVERTFPVHSPKIADITVIRKGKVRRAKLYYLRGRTGKAAKIKEVR